MARKISLVQMKIKQKAKIIEINPGSSLQNRLRSMGLVEGKEITKLSQFALRGPIAVKIGHTVLALGYGMASKIIVEIND